MNGSSRFGFGLFLGNSNQASTVLGNGGAETIDGIGHIGWAIGSIITIRFTASVASITLRHNQTPPLNCHALYLTGFASIVIPAGTSKTLSFMLDSFTSFTGGLPVWTQVGGEGTGTGGGGAVNQVHAGPGISITGTLADPVVNNTGVLSITAGTNISLTGTAQDVVINATGGGGGGAANTLFRRADVAGIKAIATTGFVSTDAHVCEVLSFGDLCRFAPGSALTEDLVELTVINATDGGGQWLRMNVPNETWQAQAKDGAGGFWLDPVGGANDNSGADAAHPILTMAEFCRRVVGGQVPPWVRREHPDRGAD